MAASRTRSEHDRPRRLETALAWSVVITLAVFASCLVHAYLGARAGEAPA